MPVLPRTAFVATPPDWVCEVLSPSTERFDREKKLRIYAAHGVTHAWLVEPIARTLEVLWRDDQIGRWALLATHEGNAVARIEPFEAIDFRLGLLWEQ
jgi:Uma2 family endonuclease